MLLNHLGNPINTANEMSVVVPYASLEKREEIKRQLSLYKLPYTDKDVDRILIEEAKLDIEKQLKL